VSRFWLGAGGIEGRSARLVTVGLLAAAAIGFVSGTRPAERRQPEAARAATGGAERAVRQAELRGLRRGPNGKMYEGAFERLAATGPAYGDVVETGPELRAEALSARAARRAWRGAPPVVPHPVTEQEVGACLGCHAEGLQLGSRAVPAVSHETKTNCLQCHALSRPEHEAVAALGGPPPVASWARLDEPGPGARAWKGAPPTIPHATQMRERCESCHGLHGRPGLRVPHPERENCQQCHASAGEGVSLRPPGLSP